MWFRIELHKDGGVRSCELVATAFTAEGRRVFYIEADSKESALVRAAGAYQRRLENERRARQNTRDRKAAEGLCRECSRSVVPGTNRCHVHGPAQLAASRRSHQRLRGKADPPPRLPLTGAKDYTSRTKRIELYVLRDALKRFEQAAGWAEYRAWLCSEIAEHEIDLGERKAPEAAE